MFVCTYFFSFTLYLAYSRKPSVKTLCSSLFAEFSRLCVLNGGTQRRAFALVTAKKYKY